MAQKKSIFHLPSGKVRALLSLFILLIALPIIVVMAFHQQYNASHAANPHWQPMCVNTGGNDITVPICQAYAQGKSYSNYAMFVPHFGGDGYDDIGCEASLSQCDPVTTCANQGDLCLHKGDPQAGVPVTRLDFSCKKGLYCFVKKANLCQSHGYKCITVTQANARSVSQNYVEIPSLNNSCTAGPNQYCEAPKNCSNQGLSCMTDSQIRANGCQKQWTGSTYSCPTNTVCCTPGKAPVEPCSKGVNSGSGWYCGDHANINYTGDSKHIYYCQDNKSTNSVYCPYGCTQAPYGQSDFCNPAPKSGTTPTSSSGSSGGGGGGQRQ